MILEEEGTVRKNSARFRAGVRHPARAPGFLGQLWSRLEGRHAACSRCVHMPYPAGMSDPSNFSGHGHSPYGRTRAACRPEPGRAARVPAQQVLPPHDDARRRRHPGRDSGRRLRAGRRERRRPHADRADPRPRTRRPEGRRRARRALRPPPRLRHGRPHRDDRLLAGPGRRQEPVHPRRSPPLGPVAEDRGRGPAPLHPGRGRHRRRPHPVLPPRPADPAAPRHHLLLRRRPRRLRPGGRTSGLHARHLQDGALAPRAVHLRPSATRASATTRWPTTA